MAANLVIVESPAKAKTIKKYLGKDYEVLASYGHVRDLIPKEGAVDTQHKFKMHYDVIEKNAKHVDAILKATKKSKHVFLATDPDREGEAISWHIFGILDDKKLLKDKPIHRVIFHEVTKTAVKDAIDNPRELSAELFDAYQARRALDYLVGFNLSPLLWKKIRGGLSAGRVQSPALRMIVERELEIEAFEKQEYWTIAAKLKAEKAAFEARLVEYKAKKVEQFTITNKKDATSAVKALNKAADGSMTVTKVEKKQRKRNPAPPFITSTLQQEAARKLGFTAQRTMRIAQQLYEGIDVGEGAVGLITYMRTDSNNIANEALDSIRDVISDRYGKDNLPAEARRFKTKSKNAQEAHEAIRPTDAARIPDSIKNNLTADQNKLYDLIWKRTIACQMIHATIDTVAADFDCGKGNRFRANGSTIKNPGFLAVYSEGFDDKAQDDDKEKTLPPLKEGQVVEVKSIDPEQHFTEPPPRFSEASLIKALEEYGIGRPSTYASIISTLLSREYCVLDKKRFKPTDTGRVVTRFLTNYFSRYVDYEFTAGLEDQLDAVSRGEKAWVPLMEDFWGAFKTQVDDIQENVERKDVVQEAMDEDCPECNKPLSIRLGRRGRFIGCTGYPDCKYTRNLDSEDGESNEPEVVEGRSCPKCESDLVIKVGRYGKFIGCSSYPDCKHIESLDKPVDLNIECPTCKQGSMMKRKSRRGRFFFSCSRYPDCKYAVWNEPISEGCPKCEWPMLTVKTTKRRGTEKVCPQEDCDFIEAVESE